MNAYAAKQEAKIASKRDRATKLRSNAAADQATVRSMGESMAGTPVLIGHHSQRRHERDLARMDAKMRRSFDATKEADRLDRAADASESGRIISSDDPEALTLLREKLAEEERRLEAIKACNGHLRAKRIADACHALYWEQTPSHAAKTIGIWRSMGRKTIPTTNAAAECRRLRQRIADLETKATTPVHEPVLFEGGCITESREDNRVRILFDGKPGEAIRSALKADGFRWSPTSQAWQRQATDSAWRAAVSALQSAGVEL